MTISEQLQRAVDEWVASKGDPKKEQAVLNLLEKPEVKALEYRKRNAAFITSHKLMALEKDPYLCWLEYVQGIEPPVSEEREAMFVGQAVDDLVTSGEQAFKDRYVAVPRRDKKTEEANPGKMLLTNGQLQTVTNAHKEFLTRHFFPREIKKRNLLCIAFGLPLKGELDGFDDETKRPQDLKTTANLNTFLEDFRPGRLLYDRYIFQQATYAYIYEMGQGERVDACELLVVDKYQWCRSHKFVISYPTLQAQFYRIEKLLQDWKLYQESEIWPFSLRLDTPEGLKAFNDSPYYSHPLLARFKDSIPPTVL